MSIDKPNESMFQRYWRPAMAWSYLVICIFDFLLAPILNAVFQSMVYTNSSYIPWNPLTLMGGGLYHISMMAIVGVTAYSRGQEKIKFLETITGLKSSNNQEINTNIIQEPSIVNTENKQS